VEFLLNYKSRAIAIFFVDLILSAVSLPVALALRLGPGELLSPTIGWINYGLYLGVVACVLIASRLHRISWRHITLSDTIVICRSVIAINLLFLFILFMIDRGANFPRTTVVINTMTLASAMVFARIVYRLLRERRLVDVFGALVDRSKSNREPVLLVGSGNEAEAFIRHIERDPEGSYVVVGLLTRRSKMVGTWLRGISIMGQIGDLEQVVEKLDQKGRRPSSLIIAASDVPGINVRELFHAAVPLSLTVKRLSQPDEFKGHQADRFEVGPLAPEDLLRRLEVPLEMHKIHQMIKGRNIMVTGGGGSIGAELVVQIAEQNPKRLILIDNSEFNLYLVDKKLKQMDLKFEWDCFIGNIRDRETMFRIFRKSKPDMVFHAAALKHVPLLEDNPEEGVLTNVVGTKNIADASVETGVSLMVLISSDKAVSPINILGATKKIAESYCCGLDAEMSKSDGTKIITVRFGNVLASSGSVVPLFKEQIENGGPVTITHKDATRYLMTIREAVQLIIQACALSNGNDETRGIIVLDMGEPVKILDLAHQLIRMSGLRPEEDIAIKTIGLRPGERVHEQLFDDSEDHRLTENENLFLAKSNVADIGITNRYIISLETAANSGSRKEVLRLLSTVMSKETIETTKAQTGSP
jgi:FlaA1/EpsC-like NDP-sugar epimerase